MLIGSAWSAEVAVLIMVSAMTGYSEELIRCSRDRDCPLEAVCFKDECARCLCPKGKRVTNFYDGTSLRKICENKPSRLRHVGASCDDVTSSCPAGSACTAGLCGCRPSLVPHGDLSHCRRPVFGERCARGRPCASGLGLRCGRRAGTCRCKASHRGPSRWAKMVLRRWDYAPVAEKRQFCVARAVGEPCKTDAHCAAVKGSRAVCGNCGLCECKRATDVPDSLGTRCGKALAAGARCTLHSTYVCDGYAGLQCGDSCPLYVSDPRGGTCRCSQMHDRRVAGCVLKKVGSGCRTDLDCYPIGEGFGYCEKGACRVAAIHANVTFRPYIVERECRNYTQSVAPPGDQLVTSPQPMSSAVRQTTTETTSSPRNQTTGATEEPLVPTEATHTTDVTTTGLSDNKKTTAPPQNDKGIDAIYIVHTVITNIASRVRTSRASVLNALSLGTMLFCSAIVRCM